MQISSRISFLWLVLLVIGWCQIKMIESASAATTDKSVPTPLAQGRSSYQELKTFDGSKSFDSFFHIPPSVVNWDLIDIPRRFSVLSMHVEFHQEARWYMSALHAKHSFGWNRTHYSKNYDRKPYACSLQFIGVGLEKTLDGFQEGGVGYMTLAYTDTTTKKQYWHGFDKNETNRLHCYYSTNKDTGSEFIDKPKTLGIAIHCPVTLDEESGPFLFHRTMHTGSYCRPIMDFATEIEIHLHPSHYQGQDPSTIANVDMSKPQKDQISSEFNTKPFLDRKAVIRKQFNGVGESASNAQNGTWIRRHAACTVQTFKNKFTGPMLYFYIRYYQLMGWRVIVYDRFGLHYDYVKELLTLPGVDYYPFTVYQLAQPSKYNKQYQLEQGEELKSFYKMEVNWGYSSKKIADTPDQDADKTRTYDYARLEYAHLDTLMFVDADELFYCPQASQSISAQREYQHLVHDEFIHRGIEEMRYVRIPYSGIAPEGFVNSAANRSQSDFTNHTGYCMIDAYNAKSLKKLAGCWSTGTSYDNFPKSADLARVCPFHYNHWSCDGMKGGGRDWTKKRCRCKVGLDMQNGYDYRPILEKCHLMHFNDNKYRFQSKRTKHTYDKGDVTIPSPLVDLLSKEY